MSASDERAGGSPEITVVIPTHERETRLAFALEALAAQTLARERFEVIVVRSPATAARAGAPAGLEVRFLESPLASRPGQRNVGWRAARGALVAFTDDDCRPAPEWLERLLAAAEPGGFVEGVTEPDPDEVHLLHGLARSISVLKPGPWHPTSNVAYPRELLERLGGFDEDFVASGEDTDLALRAIDAGARPAFASEAVVRHAVVAQPLWTAAREGWERWSTTPLLFRRHPEHRRHLYAGVFFNEAHAALAVLAAGAIAFRSRPRGVALAAAPYALLALDRRNLGPRGLARQALHLPAKAIADGARAAGLLRGAIRHRSPVV